jgi:hypothetical protein
MERPLAGRSSNWNIWNKDQLMPNGKINWRKDQLIERSGNMERHVIRWNEMHSIAKHFNTYKQLNWPVQEQADYKLVYNYIRICCLGPYVRCRKSCLEATSAISCAWMNTVWLLMRTAVVMRGFTKQRHTVHRQTWTLHYTLHCTSTSIRAF